MGAGPGPNIGAVPPAGNQEETIFRDLKRLREQGGNDLRDAAPERAGPDQATPEGRPTGPANAVAAAPRPEVRVPYVGETENIARGRAAVDSVLANQESVPGSMIRQDVGEITFDWGVPGTPAREYRDGWGLSHIIARRNLEGVDGEAFVRDVLPDMIARGQLDQLYGPHYGRRANIVYRGNTASLSLQRHQDRETWVLTAFGPKGGPGEPGGGNPATGLRTPPPRISDDVGAGPGPNIGAVPPAGNQDETTFRDLKRLREQGGDDLRDAAPERAGPDQATPEGRPAGPTGAAARVTGTELAPLDAPFPVLRQQTRDGRLFYPTPDEQAAAAFFEPGDLAAARQSHAAFKDDPEATRALAAIALDSLRAAAVRDGVLDPKRLATWVRRHQSVLAEFPEIGAAIQNYRAANRALAARQGQLAARTKTVNDRLLARRLGAVESGGAAPEALIANAVGDPRLMTAVLGGVRQDPGALEALRRHVWDQATGLPAGELVKFMHANRAALRLLFSSAHLGNLRRVQQARAIVESVPAPRGRSWQASAIDPFARLMRARSVDRRAALYREALYNPELARDLAGLAFAGKGAETRAQRLDAWLFDVGLSGPEDDER